MRKRIVLSIAVLSALLLGAASIDQLVGGATPSASGQPLCSTSTTRAAFESAATCGLSDLSSAQTISGLKTYSSGVKIGSSGATIASSLTASFSDPTPGAKASGACGTITATMTGVAAGAVCDVGTPATGASTIIYQCTYNGTNAVILTICNVGTSSATEPAGTYRCRCFNP